MPDRFLRKVTAPLGISLPPAGQYGAGFVFLPHDAGEQERLRGLIDRIVREEGHEVLGWRAVPTDDRPAGRLGGGRRAGVRAGVHRRRPGAGDRTSQVADEAGHHQGPGRGSSGRST